MITFFLVCKNGGRDEPAEEEKDVIEIDTDYREGLKILRLTKMRLLDDIKLGRYLGRIK